MHAIMGASGTTRSYSLRPPACAPAPHRSAPRPRPVSNWDGDTMLGDDTTAERRLRLLQAEFTQHERRGPGDGRTATRTESPAPVSVGVLDYINAAATEVIQHTRAAAPEAEPYAYPFARPLRMGERRPTASTPAASKPARP